MEVIWPSTCAGCGARGQGRLCAACREAHAVEPLVLEGVERVVVASWYHEPLGEAVRSAKVRADRALLLAVALAAVPVVVPALRGVDAVVPVPSPWTRRLWRGFAPASVLAGVWAAAAELPVRHALTVAPGARQATRDRSARGANLRGRVRAVQVVEGVVGLVDDVVTTGATALACARELLGTGSTAVRVVAVSAPALRDADNGRERVRFASHALPDGAEA